MFSVPSYRHDWLTRQAKEMSGCRPELLERCVYALTLLRHLAESGLPFVFKGGTSLLLHLNPVRRLSIDIDIVCGAPTAEVARIAAEIGRREPFILISFQV
jgi:predicted nucleotidyltransferase component of viral defense system